MLHRVWKPLAATTAVLAASGGGYYYWRRHHTFEVRIRVQGPDGRSEKVMRRFPLLSKEEVDNRLQQNAKTSSEETPGGVWRHTTASLASNDPFEDANMNQVVARDADDPAHPGKLLFYGVLDGHSGPHTSRLLSQTMIRAVVSELSELIYDPAKYLPDPGVFRKFSPMIRTPTSVSYDADPKYVSLALQNAFTMLDNGIISYPLEVLAREMKAPLEEGAPIPDLSKHPLGMPSIQAALSGSCALLALIDTAHRNLYIACTGDARAVAGIWEEQPDGQGHWRVEVLSEDQTGLNPDEIKRMQSEHPPEESEHVIRHGRVLGGLQPTRAFGDAPYKWPQHVQDALNQAFMFGNGMEFHARPRFKTPPYVTATPVVTHLNFDSLNSDSSEPGSKSTFHFLVLATDGLWDELSSEEVVALVGGHFAGIKGTIPKSTLQELVPTTLGARTVEGKELQIEERDDDGSWVFADENISTHLIRNAFGRGDARNLRELLSIPAPHSRRYRDDVTVTVVWWEDGQEDGQASAPEVIQAKL